MRMKVTEKKTEGRIFKLKVAFIKREFKHENLEAKGESINGRVTKDHF